MGILDTAEVDQVIPFDQFPIETDRDRIVVPMPNPVFLTTTPAIVGDGFGGFTTDPPSMIMQTYERTPDGWRRMQ